MPKSLIIVESPSKAKTINKYLGKSYVVEATVGHIKNLPSNDLGVDIEAGFIPRYVNIRGKASVIKQLRDTAAKAESVYIATDPDREGEAIAAHIAGEIAKQVKNKNVYRVLFNEITKSGIQAAMANPRRIDDKMVDAQQARRVLDRLVGYQVSPFLWKAIYRGLSAGRVQSVALRFICERELEIQAFIIQEYWSITAEYQKPGDGSFHAKLAKIDGADPVISTEAEAMEILGRMKERTYAIEDVSQKEVNRTPPPPFITSTLQQEASNRLRFGAKRTMALAQQLYEGVDLGEEGAVGLITYMRTDSTRISGEALEALRTLIADLYGAAFLPASPRVYKVKSTAQDAHEAIRPTSMEWTPQRVRPFLTNEQYALYELIWKRFVASQMANAVIQQTTILVRGGEFLLKGVGSVYSFRGFLQVYDDFVNDGNGVEVEEEETTIPEGLTAGDSVHAQSIDPHQHFTKPPPRYTESSLVKELEARGIGRPSTYASIVSTILERGYVDQKERKLTATPLGMDVYKILMEHFESLFNVAFTAKMEEDLDTIASGEASYKSVMEGFYLPFRAHLDSIDPNTVRPKEYSDQTCEKCGRPMIVRWGRNGRFLACDGYPDCKNAKPLPEDVEKMKVQDPCPQCGQPLMLKQSRYGKFIGCSGYPDCTYTRPITLGIACPKCKEGEVVERMSKSKRTFYGCTTWPACDFVSWERPVAETCPSCKNHYLLHKYSQKKGEYLKCPQCKEEFGLDLSPLDPVQTAA